MTDMDDVRNNFQDLLKHSYLSDDPTIAQASHEAVQRAHTSLIQLQDAAEVGIAMIRDVTMDEDHEQLKALRARVRDLEVIHHAIEYFDIMVEEHLEQVLTPSDFTPEDIIGRRELEPDDLVQLRDDPDGIVGQVIEVYEHTKQGLMAWVQWGPVEMGFRGRRAHAARNLINLETKKADS